MNTLPDIVAATLVLIGSLFALTAAIGLVRFPDTISRMHPSTKTQVFGLLLILIGAGIRLHRSVDVGMLVLAGLFTFIVSPVFAHLAGRASYRERGPVANLVDVPPDTEPDGVISGDPDDTA